MSKVDEQFHLQSLIKNVKTKQSLKNATHQTPTCLIIIGNILLGIRIVLQYIISILRNAKRKRTPALYILMSKFVNQGYCYWDNNNEQCKDNDPSLTCQIEEQVIYKLKNLIHENCESFNSKSTIAYNTKGCVELQKECYLNQQCIQTLNQDGSVGKGCQNTPNSCFEIMVRIYHKLIIILSYVMLYQLLKERDFFTLIKQLKKHKQKIYQQRIMIHYMRLRFNLQSPQKFCVQIELAQLIIKNQFELDLVRKQIQINLGNPFVISENTKQKVTQIMLLNDIMIYFMIGISGLSLQTGNAIMLFNLLDLLQSLSYIKSMQYSFPPHFLQFLNTYTKVSLQPILELFQIEELFRSLNGKSLTFKSISQSIQIQANPLNQFYLLDAQDRYFSILCSLTAYFISVFYGIFQIQRDLLLFNLNKIQIIQYFVKKQFSIILFSIFLKLLQKQLIQIFNQLCEFFAQTF
ncbi:unnamed protein product [Paramecium sonneborni]|uniref:Transmembrane protein n=1 Tax=Paramecium sonneborni TaxID=65129 RepID=A0A8S1RCW1_9CILI|nr:unnamed protein product [Paramecium sonneborni]